MKCILMYDITHDGIRVKVADLCLDYGMERIQYSAFLGNLSSTHQRELFTKIRDRVGKQLANIQLVPIDERSWANRRCIERKLVGNE